MGSKDNEAGEVDFSKDENEDRGNWSGKLDFLLSCLGYAVGLGNVWRFPYKCYKNGGGAFFIPYFIMLLFVGMPILFMELSLGQFTSSGPFTCWKFAPILQGIGYGMVIISAIVAMYYNMIIGWALYYLFGSFTSDLPWQHCDRSWNTEYCFLRIPDMNCTDAELDKGDNGLCYNTTAGNQSMGLWNATLAELAGIKRKSASEEYFYNNMMRLSDDITEIGSLQWELALCLLLGWIIVFFSLCKGIKSSGKVVYFTATFPYIVLVILLIRGLTLEGHQEGIKYYLTPDWSRLADVGVWQDAASQIFFSLSACWGGLITLSSYNRFHNNVLRDTLIVCIGNCLTSVFAGFVIFSFLGFMAHTMNTTVDKVAAAGTGLAFVVYPDAVSHMPVSPLWSILFFLMLITLGLDTEFALLETVTTSMMDRWPELRKKKTWVILACSVFFYGVGLLFCTEAGGYIFELLDAYAGGWCILLIGVCESIAMMGLYGWNKWSSDIEVMIGKKPWIWWRICWTAITPLLCTGVMIFSWVDYSPITLGDYTFPPFANGIGWGISVLVALPIPVLAIFVLVTGEGDTFMQRLRNGCSPTEDWGPALEKHQRLVTHMAEISMESSVGNGQNLHMKQGGAVNPTFVHDDAYHKGVRM